MALATVDIGTNSAKILVADWDDSRQVIKPLFQDVRLCRLGEGSQHDCVLKDKAMQRTIYALKEFKSSIDRWNVSQTIVAATMCTREAKNQKQFCDLVKKETGWSVRVLSGAEEALYSFRGARTRWPSLSYPLAAVDIGGGSSEWIVARSQGDCAIQSLALGGVRETENLLSKQPPPPKEIKRLNEHIAQIFKSLPPELSPPSGTSFIGIGGTVTTIADMVGSTTQFNCSSLKSLIDTLGKLTVEERLKKYPKLEPGRADVIYAASTILAVSMDVFHLENIYVSERGLRFGLLEALAQGWRG